MAPRPKGWIIFADLHGTLLDRRTNGSGPARAALRSLAASDTPLVLVSSKSLPDMLAVRRGLGHREAFIFENGGGAALPKGSLRSCPKGFSEEGGLWVRLLGPGRERLLEALADIQGSTGASVAEVGRMPLAELMARTGFGPGQARRCRSRRCSAPFFLDDPRDLSCVTQAAGRLGFRVAHGGRFYHLLGSADKGTAAMIVKRLLGGGRRTAALGDAQTDAPLFKVVDRPYIVQAEPGKWELMRLKGLRRVPAPGPAGVALAVRDLLEGTDRYR
ncbi:MAG: hypothetical protein WC943_06920 [Elusimicrobiota bacterium]|jgi:mannosyl-3-phosphoglycerate phosphatase